MQCSSCNSNKILLRLRVTMTEHQRLESTTLEQYRTNLSSLVQSSWHHGLKLTVKYYSFTFVEVGDMKRILRIPPETRIKFINHTNFTEVRRDNPNIIS